MKKTLPLLFLALSCGTTNAKPPAAGSSGAFGVVTVDGKQKMYLPLDTPQIAVVDVGLAGNGVTGAPAQIALVDLGGTDVADSSGGDDTVVIAASTTAPTVWFIDPHTDKLVKTLALPTDAQQSSFSGGGGYVTGIAVDSAHRRAVLSVWNGFAIVDLDSKEIVKTIQAAPAENFGYDSAAQRIIAPYYGCPSALTFCQDYKTAAGDVIYDGLNVIDLADDTVYTYQDPSASSPNEPVGGEPDSAAADPATGLVVVPSESNGFTTLLDLAHASFDKASKTFTAPHKQLDTSAGSLTGVAAEPEHHLALWEAEHSSGIGVADLGQESQGHATLVMGDMPEAPGYGYWSNIGDPHGIAVTAGIRDGRPVGFLVSSDRHWVARIDLQGLLGVQHTAGTTVAGTLVAPFVTFLDATTRP